MALLLKVITSQSVKETKAEEMDENDVYVCKKWLSKERRLKFSRIFNIIVFLSSIIAGTFIYPCYYAALAAALGQLFFEFKINDDIYLELKRNGGLSKMKELLKEFKQLNSKHKKLKTKTIEEPENSITIETKHTEIKEEKTKQESNNKNNERNIYEDDFNDNSQSNIYYE